MFCRKCGTQYDNELEACPSCGTPNSVKPKANIPAPQQQKIQTPQPQNNNFTFKQNLIFPWIKGSVNIDETFVNLSVTHTSLGGVLPSGKSNDRIPISKISSCDLSEGVKVGRVIWGVILFLFSAISKAGTAALLMYSGNSNSTFIFTLLMLLAVLIVASAFNQELNIQREGSDERITIAPSDVAKGRMIQAGICKAIKEQSKK